PDGMHGRPRAGLSQSARNPYGHMRYYEPSAGRIVNAEPFAQLSREPTLVERVAGSILDRIVAGELKPGDKLPSERELGEQFGVSRTVVREAVRGLTGRGVVTVRAGSGLRVAAIDPAAVSESLALLLRSNHEFD